MDAELALNRIRPSLVAAGGALPSVRAFERMYRAYRAGATGQIRWEDVSPLEPGDLVSLESLEGGALAEKGRALLDQVVWVILNGGLGTTMRMERAKSLVPVKGDLCFLDLIARHVLELRRRGRRIPLLLMNSFATRSDTLLALEPYPLRVIGEDGLALPLDFLQHRFPRVRVEDGLPLGDLEDREAWAPPGHGDVYLALQVSGVLGKLLRMGIRWAFISNADNLGASVHPGILGLLENRGYQFLLEVTRKTPADVKGGTLFRRRGRLELLEVAQVPPDHRADFENVEMFPVFNTNSLWVDLEALQRRLAADDFALPLIVNRKEVRGVSVVQLESAMGAAIGAFERSAGILVPRTRFAPVKTTDDLLVRRSDVYRTGGAAPLVPNPDRPPELGPPLVCLDPRFYGSVPDLDLRIPDPPSLLRAERLEVVGDVRFGRGVVVTGEARVENTAAHPLHISDGALLP